MSGFEGKIITKVYAKKDLSEFNLHISSISNCPQGNVASKLKDIYESYNELIRAIDLHFIFRKEF